MKILYTILITIVLSVTAFAREAGPGFYVEYGQSLTPVQTHYLTEESGWGYTEEQEDYMAYTDIRIHYVFDVWNVQVIPFGATKTWYIPSSIVTGGKPFCDIYTIGLEITYGRLSFSIDHYCAHPVRSNKEMWQTKEYRMGQNMNEIKLRYAFN